MYQLDFNGVTLVFAAQQAIPFDADGVVYEQDTALLLSTDDRLVEPPASTETLVAEMETQPSLALGSVVVSETYPFELLAIVHDVEQEPMCNEASLKTALFNIIQACEARRLTTLAMPLLGTVFGRIPPLASAALLKSVLCETPPRYLQTLLLVAADEGKIPALFELFR